MLGVSVLHDGWMETFREPHIGKRNEPLSASRSRLLLLPSLVQLLLNFSLGRRAWQLQSYVQKRTATLLSFCQSGRR